LAPTRPIDSYHTLLERSFEFLAHNPFAARKRLELSPPVRIHPVQSHLVIYQVEDDGSILIVRVRHGHEDWAEPLTDQRSCNRKSFGLPKLSAGKWPRSNPCTVHHLTPGLRRRSESVQPFYS